ncbi:MAG: succinate-semialdehyde dehydrogenase (NADP+) [Rhodobacteraceae bacterium]|nr:MAG: succinate-semialdehyde dehydrogenase (NADP+) [Paracoccaceae bacterium]
MISDLNGKMYIGGTMMAAQSATVAVFDPATGDKIGMVGAATAAEIEAAVSAARAAFGPWSGLPAKARSGYLHRLGDVIAADADAMARLMTLEQGKPVNEARGEILKLAETCHFYAEEAVRIHGETIPNDTNDFDSTVLREPIGVVGAITPWNYPAELVGWKLCGALAAGCTIVIKPAEITPFTALAIGAKCIDAGIPAGVVNVITGPGSEVGQAMVEHKGIDKIAFTGSSKVGLRIQQSATSVKRMALELGGNCPMIVTASADLKAAVAGAARRSFRNCGQICIAINRIYVARPIYESFLIQLAQAADGLRVANGLTDPCADLGPMASAEPLGKTREHLADALSKGARLLAGGAAPQGAEFAKGHFFRPTVLADCTHDMHIMTEETFGPIVGIAPFDTLTEAVALANDTPYGLASYVYSKASDDIRYLSRGLDYGSVAVNTVDAGIINAPYGGRKQSGLGYEHGREGMLEYMNFKHIRVRFDLPEGA